jgi:hypothetical protein
MDEIERGYRDKLEDELRRGEDAAQLLRHPLFVSAFETLEQEIVDQWKQSTSLNADAREKLHTMLFLLGKIRTQIQTHVETGKLAQATFKERVARTLGKRSTPF